MNDVAEPNVIWSGTTPEGRAVVAKAFAAGNAPIRYIVAEADGSIRHCGTIEQVAMAMVGAVAGAMAGSLVAIDHPRPTVDRLAVDRLALAATYAAQIHRAAKLRLTSGWITDKAAYRFEQALCEAAGAATLSLFRQAGFDIFRAAGRTSFATVPDGLEGYRDLPVGCRAAIEEGMLLERARLDTAFDW